MADPTTVAPSSPTLDPKVAPVTNPEAPGLVKWADQRIALTKLSKPLLRKVFPDHWSFMLGEIALFSFIVLLLTGVFLTIWFVPSMAEIEYDGSYQLLKGMPVSEAFASTLNISFDVRGGLLVRQIHHWAALLFVAAATVHMLRVFFTGAFRKPREVNWLIGVGLLSLSLIAGFAGYSLPDDLLSGTGLRFVNGLVRSIPIIGTWAEFFVFGGEFPGDILIARLYMVHILLVPGILLGLISAHMALMVYHKHGQFPGPGRTENNVVGYPMFPVYISHMGGFFFIVFGVLVLMGGLFQINPVWLYGPYDPSKVTAGSQPDWYMGWVEGAIRIMPALESSFWGTTWTWGVFLPGIGLMGVLFTALGAWPFIEAWITGDKREHHLLDRPRNAPVRTALGVAGMTWYGMFWIAGGNDIIATRFALDLNVITQFTRVAVFVGPVIAFMVTKRICLSLQRADRERALHGSEDGVIVRSPSGGYSESHVPVSHEEQFVLTQHLQHKVLVAGAETDAAGVRRKGGVSRLRARLSRWYLSHDIAKPTALELEAAAHHGSPGHSTNGVGPDGHAVDGVAGVGRELDGPRHRAGADKAGLHH
ncbi:MAG TPA: ubiquinol-cytochrome c reductase cytochrome b subunit [Arachnia sp.]|nr:ubiquinol-cytochrome c reductase cytochrome b subunit [Arachnia sp.]